MSNFNNNAPRQPRKKFWLNDWRQALPQTEQPVDGGKYPAQMMWDITNAGKIVFKVSDGIFKEGKGGSSYKEVEMDAMQRGALFEALLDAANNPNFTTHQFSVRWKAFVFTGGQSKMSENPITHATFTISRDANGVIFLGFTKGDYKANFKFRGPRDSVIYIKDASGERKEDHGIMSRFYVRGYVNFHRSVLDRMELESWEPPKPKDGGNNSNGNRQFNNNGSGNGGGNSQGGNGNFDADFDDADIDF